MNTKAALIAALVVGVFIMMKNKSGSSKKPRGIRNNNPLNIRISGDNWQGANGDDGEFVTFETPEKGIRAAARILKNYRDKYGLKSVGQIITRWAPPTENNTASYIKNVAKKVGISANEDLLDYEYQSLISAMIYHENGQQPYSSSVIADAFEQGFYV